MRALLLFGAALWLVMHGTASAASRDLTPEGIWLHSNKRIQVEIVPCGEHLCGKVVWLKNPTDEKGLPRTDQMNPNPAQRTEPVMGMTVIRGLAKMGSRVWTDGEIYNPDDGETYSASVTVVNADTVRVRAHIILPLFGKTLVWTRVGTFPRQPNNRE